MQDVPGAHGLRAAFFHGAGNLGGRPAGGEKPQARGVVADDGDQGLIELVREGRGGLRQVHEARGVMQRGLVLARERLGALLLGDVGQDGQADAPPIDPVDGARLREIPAAIDTVAHLAAGERQMRGRVGEAARPAAVVGKRSAMSPTLEIRSRPRSRTSHSLANSTARHR